MWSRQRCGWLGMRMRDRKGWMISLVCLSRTLSSRKGLTVLLSPGYVDIIPTNKVSCTFHAYPLCFAQPGHFFLPSFSPTPSLPILSPSYPSHIPLTICSSSCFCSSSSSAQSSCQHVLPLPSDLPVPVILRPSPIASLGLFATHPIPKGAFICTYAGEVISDHECTVRWERTRREGGMNFIFCLSLGHGREKKRVNIDPARTGGIG
jgi:hypothetical protein